MNIKQQMFIQSLGLRPENYIFIGARSELDILSYDFLEYCLGMDSGDMATELAMQLAMLPRIKDSMIAEIRENHKSDMIIGEENEEGEFDLFVNKEYIKDGN